MLGNVKYMKSSGFIRTLLLVGTELQEKEQALMTCAFPLFFIYSVIQRLFQHFKILFHFCTFLPIRPY